jgi:REP element-mobilizing transposase RayT
MVLQRISNRMIVMPYNADQHHRRSIRLSGYDYAQAGAYFVTLCTHQRECLFGEVVDGEMRLNAFGCVVEEEWFASARIRQEIELDAFVVVPNHIHGIVWIAVGATGRSPVQTSYKSSMQHRPRGPAPRSLGAFVAGYKSAVTKRINALRNTPSAPVWQRDYHEHVIRNETALDAMRTYIVNNPSRWDVDRYNHQADLTARSSRSL